MNDKRHKCNQSFAAVNLGRVFRVLHSIYLGWLLNGTVGGLVAGTLFVLPGYIALMALSAIYAQWGATTAVAAVFAGLGPAAVLGSTLAVWVTFVPCFLFVFLGAPHIEGLRHNTKLAAALAGITPAVVGVIANLSIYFSIHTLFSRTRTHNVGPIHVTGPLWSSLSPRALFVTGLAFMLVFRFKFSVLRVLGLCAVVGAKLHVL